MALVWEGESPLSLPKPPFESTWLPILQMILMGVVWEWGTHEREVPGISLNKIQPTKKNATKSRKLPTTSSIYTLVRSLFYPSLLFSRAWVCQVTSTFQHGIPGWKSTITYKCSKERHHIAFLLQAWEIRHTPVSMTCSFTLLFFRCHCIGF